jgi:hypothetical protein
VAGPERRAWVAAAGALLVRTESKKNSQKQALRNIHAALQPKMSEEPHEYCAKLFKSRQILTNASRTSIGSGATTVA